MDDVKKLISEVHERPMLWDPSNENYHNKWRVACEWQKAAIDLKTTVYAVHVKWKNLRNQFDRELKYVLTPRYGDSVDYSTYFGCWPFFSDMGFLCRVITPHSNTSNLGYINDSIILPTIETARTPSPTPSLPSTQSSVIVPSTVTRHLSKSRAKRSDISDTKCQEQLLGIESKKLTLSSETDDDDLHFFRSLLPFFKELDPLEKLELRHQIQSFVLDKVTKKNSPGASSSSYSTGHSYSDVSTFTSNGSRTFGDMSYMINR